MIPHFKLFFKIPIMKQLTLFILAIILFSGFSGCGSRDKSKTLGEYKYETEESKLNEVLQKKVGSWVKEGLVCYGIVILNDENGLPKKVKEFQSKIISIQKDKIKMKSLEDLRLAPVKGCTKIGMKKGDIWEETDGDLFQTKEEAIKFIETNYPDMRAK